MLLLLTIIMYAVGTRVSLSFRLRCSIFKCARHVDADHFVSTNTRCLRYSLEVTGPPSAVFTRHALVSAGRTDANVVVVRTEEPVTGTLRVTVDQSSEG